MAIANTGRVYAALSGLADPSVEGVWTSPDGINSWVRLNPFTPAGRVVLALAPSNQNKLYVLFVNGNTADCIGPVQEADLWLWNFTNESFTNLTNLLPFEGGCLPANDPFSVQLGWDLTVAVKPDDEDFVLIGGTNAYKKDDINNPSSRFVRIGGYLNSNSYDIYNSGTGIEQHPDQHEFVFSSLNPNVCFSATDGGIHRTDDISATTVGWQNLNINFQTYQFFHVNQDPLPGSDIVIGGTQDNGTTVGGIGYGLPSPTVQSRIFGGDGVAVAIARNPACRAYFGVQNGPMFRVGCTGSGFAEITPIGSNSQFVTYFYLDPDNNNAIYYAGENTLYRSTNAAIVNSSTWTNLGNTSSAFGHGDFFQTFSTSKGTYDPAESYLLMGGDEGHIYRLDDPWNSTNINTAIDITPSTATTGFPSYVTGLAVHPTNNDIVLATYSNYGITNIFLTTNATDPNPTWTVVERNLFAHSIRSAAITEVDGEVLYYVGTARGLYSSSDPITVDWVREAPNQIGFALVSSLTYRNADKKLLIGTFGNGIFEGSLTGTLNDNEFALTDSELKIFPNPVMDILQINTEKSKEEMSFRILNSLGQVVRSHTIYNDHIDVSDLESGIYFVETQYQEMKIIKRFIKQ